jgi:hypothetical protein
MYHIVIQGTKPASLAPYAESFGEHLEHGERYEALPLR